MPELPEVETSKRGLAPLVIGRRILGCVIRNAQLRWEIPHNLGDLLRNAEILELSRRAKYLLLKTSAGSLILHLGMSGSLRVLPESCAAEKHDHVDIRLDHGSVIRYRDPRRFGAMLWGGSDPMQHPLLVDLGPEPLDPAFHGEYLFAKSRKRKTSIKQLIMDNHIVVGVGNIYANEALFLSGLRPGRCAAKLTRQQANALCANIKRVLLAAIDAGGSSLRDFTQADGNPGYFQQQLRVYGRDGEPCDRCGSLIKAKRIGQRNSFYCPQCQK